MSIWHIDFETRSRADLTEIGAFKYAQDPSTEVMCLAIKRDDGPTLVWIPPEFEVRDALAGDTVSDVGARELLEAMLADDGPLYAFNAVFEHVIFRYVMPRYGFAEPDLKRWRCAQAMARRANIPASLGKAAATLALKNQKDAAGGRLINTFSIPQKDTGEFIQPYQSPDKWHSFVEYCRQDVETEHEMAHVLKPFDLGGWLLDTFHIDLVINDRGMPVNMTALRNANKMIDDTSVPAFEEFNRLTGLNPTQNAKLRVWFAENGLQLDNLQSDTLAALDVSTLPEAPGQAIALLRKIGFAAVKKIKTMIECAGDDGFIRGSLQFYGAAATGRWSGRLHQPQNFKRPEFGGTEEMYDHVCNGASKEFLELWYGKDIFSILASSIRHFIHDPQGPMLSADYSAIEARVAAWLAGEEWKLEVFRTHGKIYEMNAERMFGVPMAQVDKSLRQKSKIAELACQYAGSVNALITMGALDMGLKEEELQPLVDAWRTANPNIVKQWYACSNAAISAVNSPGEKFFAGKVAYFCGNAAKAKYLFCVLPSGRRLAYRDPQVKSERRVSKRTGNEYTQQVLTCFGQLPGAGGAKSQQMGQVYLSPGLLFENCLAEGTEVKTGRGWVPIEGVLLDDLVWDGVEWVRHGGVVSRGVQQTINCHGVWATPEHEFLTLHGWQPAERACRLPLTKVSCLNETRRFNRQKTGGADDPPLYQYDGERSGQLAHSLPLREGECESRAGHAEERTERVRPLLPPFAKSNFREEQEPRHVLASGVRGVEVDERPMQTPNTPRMEELRRERDNCLQSVEKEFRELLGGHGRGLEERTGPGSEGQQFRVQLKELPLDNSEGEHEKQTPLDQAGGFSTGLQGAMSGEGNQDDNLGLPHKRRMGLEEDHKHPSKLPKQVFDIINCGPRRRFAARGKGESRYLIAHNCVQASAFDLMANGVLKAEAKGYRSYSLIHDEVLAAFDGPHQSLAEFQACLEDTPPWAAGLPLGTSGEIVKYYTK